MDQYTDETRLCVNNRLAVFISRIVMVKQFSQLTFSLVY